VTKLSNEAGFCTKFSVVKLILGPPLMLAGSSTHPCGVGNGSFDAGTDQFTHDCGQLNQDWTKAPPAFRQSLQ
jgi:hypothetical protein